MLLSPCPKKCLILWQNNVARLEFLLGKFHSSAPRTSGTVRVLLNHKHLILSSRLGAYFPSAESTSAVSNRYPPTILNLSALPP